MDTRKPESLKRLKEIYGENAEEIVKKN